MSDSFNVVLVRDRSNQLKDFYYILRDVSRERDPEKVLAWANRNKHLWEHLLTEKPEGNTFLNVWDIKGKKTDLGLSDRAANIFGERKGYGDTSVTSWIIQQFPVSTLVQFNRMGAEYKKAVQEVVATVPTEDARSIKLAVRRLANATLTPLKFIVKLLEDSYPPHFTYKGFKIENPDHFSRYVTNQILEGIEGLVATFKKRHVLPMLTQGISKITIRYWEFGKDTLNRAASYNKKTGELTLLKRLIVHRSGGNLGDFIFETTVHEFAHHVYYRQLSKEALNFWDSGWGPMEEAKFQDMQVSDADRKQYGLEKREDRVKKQMGFPTDYAGTNPSEDFAETLMMFLLKPERLSKNALYRMQRTLSLSNLYGKPIMQLAKAKELAKTEEKVQEKVKELAKKLILEGHADLALQILAKMPAWRISKSGIKNQARWFRGKPYTVETVPISKLEHMYLHEEDPECGKHIISVDYKTKETSGGCTNHINSLREAIHSNKEMPPIVLYKDKYTKGYGVQDGNHRVAAAILEGYKEVPALVPTEE